MFLGRNRFLYQGRSAKEEVAGPGVGENTEFLNNVPIPVGMQRLLARKGIHCPADLANLLQSSPRIPFRKIR